MRSSIASACRALRICLFGLTLAVFSGPGTAQQLAPTRPDGGPMTDARRVQTTVDQANRLMQEKQFDSALKTVDAGLKTSPRDPRLRFLYGVILDRLGRGKEAADVFQQLTEDYPELPEPYNNLAVLAAASGDLTMARTWLERAVRALPNYALAQENLGDVYVRLATEAYQRAAKLDPRGDGTRKLTLATALQSRLEELAAAPARSSRNPATARPAERTRPDGTLSGQPFETSPDPFLSAPDPFRDSFSQ